MGVAFESTIATTSPQRGGHWRSNTWDPVERYGRALAHLWRQPPNTDLHSDIQQAKLPEHGPRGPVAQ